MGCCFSGESEESIQQPSLEERRQLQAEAAELRFQQQNTRGIANPDSVKRHQRKAAAAENLRLSVGKDEGRLRWQVSS
ncbi:unnamed protein product [Hymenolepis diminuta]|uniref:Small VCP/p97-interacting protein n=1 Tax=Hymenolepis diminuta TaxID=6216 RepID=A0A0R3SW00_HYMDI|nr:unnamed protein product [Hymenolepis diminuta]VUZ51092.1 unnamed protein product [Hymenolepis diminuta]